MFGPSRCHEKELQLRGHVPDHLAVPALTARRRRPPDFPGIVAVVSKREIAAQLLWKLPRDADAVWRAEHTLHLEWCRGNLSRRHLPSTVAADANGLQVRQHRLAAQRLLGFVQNGVDILRLCEQRAPHTTEDHRRKGARYQHDCELLYDTPPLETEWSNNVNASCAFAAQFGTRRSQRQSAAPLSSKADIANSGALAGAATPARNPAYGNQSATTQTCNSRARPSPRSHFSNSVEPIQAVRPFARTQVRPRVCSSVPNVPKWSAPGRTSAVWALASAANEPARVFSGLPGTPVRRAAMSGHEGTDDTRSDARRG